MQAHVDCGCKEKCKWEEWKFQTRMQHDIRNLNIDV